MKMEKKIDKKIYRWKKFSTSKNFSNETTGIAINKFHQINKIGYKKNKSICHQMFAKAVRKTKKMFSVSVFNVTQRKIQNMENFG